MKRRGVRESPFTSLLHDMKPPVMTANDDATRLAIFGWVSLPRDTPNEALRSFLTQHGASVYQETNFHLMVEKTKQATDWEAVREQLKKKKRKHL